MLDDGTMLEFIEPASSASSELAASNLHDSVEAPSPCSKYLGVWRYSARNQEQTHYHYALFAGSEPRSGMLYSEGTTAESVSGTLEPDGSWFKACLATTQSKRMMGSIRLRLGPEPRTVLSQFLAPGGSEWVNDSVAHVCTDDELAGLMQAMPKEASPGYGRCKQCHSETLQISSQLVLPATRLRTGTRQHKASCEHCGYHESRLSTIYRIPGEAEGPGGGYQARLPASPQNHRSAGAALAFQNSQQEAERWRCQAAQRIQPQGGLHQQMLPQQPFQNQRKQTRYADIRNFIVKKPL